MKKEERRTNGLKWIPDSTGDNEGYISELFRRYHFKNGRMTYAEATEWIFGFKRFFPFHWMDV